MNAKYIFTKSVQISIIVLLAIKLYGCANKSSGPQGGPKDETPPVVKKETPLNGTLNYKTKEVEVIFDENILLENTVENVLISPPQKKPAKINAYGKKLSIKFEDELIDSTTYTISFGDAIVDNNEKNVLKGYNFSFATGNILDSLEVSGTLINAEDLNPMGSRTIGIHADMSDSAFTTKPFMRITRTDENGHFSIKNIRTGSYRIFALNDVNRDYMRQPGEGLAIYDSIVTPTWAIEQMTDTVWADSTTVDSVRTYMGTAFYPNNVLLQYYEENRKRQYFIKSERKEAHYFKLYFATEAKEPATLKALSEPWNENALIQYNPTNDTITYWLKDTSVIACDSLQFEMTYLKSDSLYQLQPQTDTILVVYRAPRAAAKNKRDKEREDKKTEFLKFTNNATGTFEIYNPIRLNMNSPLASIDTSKIHLAEIVDTLAVTKEHTFRAIDSISMNYEMSYQWEPEKQYEITIDSAALVDIYGLHNDKFSSKINIRSLDEYSKLIVRLNNYDPRAMIQIMSDKDEVVRTLPAHEEGTTFEHLSPKEYYMRLFIDSNGDGKWTTGEYDTQRKPEQVYYFPSKLTLRANWDFEENWTYDEEPLLDQKPSELRKDASQKKD